MTLARDPSALARDPDEGVTYTLITCHFGDPFWISHMLAHVQKFSDSRIARILVVDQSRVSSRMLSRLPGVSEVLTFAADSDQRAAHGHDHAHALNRAVRSIDESTTHVLIMDSDCFPVRSDWLDHLRPTTLARDPRAPELSHPCLMSFPAMFVPQIDFAEGLSECIFDTGRAIARQLRQAGDLVWMAKPESAIAGLRGHRYLQGSVYHHGSASFLHSDDPRVRGQVRPVREQVFQQAIAEGRFHLTGRDLARIGRHEPLRTARWVGKAAFGHRVRSTGAHRTGEY